MSSDCLTVDALMDALYACMSFEANTLPDYDRFRKLFSPGANVLPPSDDSILVSAVSVDEFIETSQDTLASSKHVAKSGFTESETHRVTQDFASVIQVFSTYESRVHHEDLDLTGRGINALQLVWQDQRWWIISLVWDDEGPDARVPKKYLP
jgi:hypothetical protein